MVVKDNRVLRRQRAKILKKYDCFYFDTKIIINKDLNESYKKLNNIIFCVDYIINNKSSFIKNYEIKIIQS